MKCAIPHCPNWAKLSATGRPGRFCSDSCKQKAYRLRQKTVTKLLQNSVTKDPDILFYCGINENVWNHHPVSPGNFACIAPVYGKTKRSKVTNNVAVPAGVSIIQDSGAFSDTTDARLSFEQALHRQVAHAYRFGYFSGVSHVASYDLLIDEKWQDGERSKIRWSVEEAEQAVQETIQAARYLAKQRRKVSGMFGHKVGLILSAQGVEAEQYLHCAQAIVPLMQEGDIFGLGGWCITGMFPNALMPSFRDIMSVVIPFLGAQGIRRTHIWGVCFAEALGFLLALCDRAGISLSTDSAGPNKRPILGEWGYASWRNNAYKVPPILDSCKVVDGQGRKTPTCAPDTRCRGQERARHVQLTRAWLADFREREPHLCMFGS